MGIACKLSPGFGGLILALSAKFFTGMGTAENGFGSRTIIDEPLDVPSLEAAFATGEIGRYFFTSEERCRECSDNDVRMKE